MTSTSETPPARPVVSGPEYIRLVAIGALIGIPAAFLAAGFLALVHYLQHWIWDDLSDALGYSSPPWFLVLFLPVVGAAVVVLARAYLPGDGGHAPLQGIGGGSPVPVAHAPGIALAALATLVFGAVLGPEAPLIALGSVVGVAAMTVSRARGQRTASVLSTAGSFAAISALFGGPLVAGVLMVEGAVGMGAAALPVLLPGFVAAAVGYTIIIGFGDWGGLNVPGLVVPDLPVYDGTHVLDLLLAVVVGVATAFLIVLIREIAVKIADRGVPRLGMPLLLLGGGLLVGAVAVVADSLGADSKDVLFSGQASVPALAQADSTKIILILVVAKALAYAVSLGSGFRGGPVFPAIFIGIAVAALPAIWLDVSPTWAVAVGTAAGAASMTRLLLTSMLFAGLLVGTAGLDAVPAAVLAASAAWLTMVAIGRRLAEGVEPPAPAAA